MRWTPGGSSSNDVEDRRGQGGGFGGGGMRMGLGGFVVLLVLSLVFRKDFFSLLGADGAPAARPPSQPPPAPGGRCREEDERAQFVTFVLDDTQDTWTKLLAVAASRTSALRWCSSATPRSPPVASDRRPRARSTVPAITGSTSTWDSTTSYGTDSGPRAISRKPT